MNIKKSKVAIVGCGLVGSSTAFSLVTQGVCDEVLLIDRNPEKAVGEVLDLRDTIMYLNRNVRVTAGDYALCQDADLVVITAGPPPRPGQTRLDTLEAGAEIVSSIVKPIMKSGFQGIFIVVSNPVDILSFLVYQLSGLPKNQVIGTGTSVDTARLQNQIADIVGVDPRSVFAYSMGEHGDSQMVPWSAVTIAGKPIQDVIADNRDKMSLFNMEDIVDKTARGGWEIYNRKGTTYYGIASACAGIIKAVLYDENIIMPVSALLEGEYGEKAIFAGVPCILNRKGVSDILEIHMQDEEKKRFAQSAEVIRQNIEKIKHYFP